MKLEKTSIKTPMTINHEIIDGKVHILAVVEVENLYITGRKVIDIK